MIRQIYNSERVLNGTHMRDDVRVPVVEVPVVRLWPLLDGEAFDAPDLQAGLRPRNIPCWLLVSGMLSDLLLKLCETICVSRLSVIQVGSPSTTGRRTREIRLTSEPSKAMLESSMLY